MPVPVDVAKALEGFRIDGAILWLEMFTESLRPVVLSPHDMAQVDGCVRALRKILAEAKDQTK